MEQTPQKLHPLLIVAASALTVASLAAIASFAGLLPLKSTPEATLTAANAPAATPPALPNSLPPAAPPQASKPAAKPPAPPVSREPARPVGNRPPVDERSTIYGGSAAIDQPPPPALRQPAPPPCRDCGTVEAVREIAAPTGEASGLGAVAGGVVGGLLGNQVGRGKGNQAATVIGALGGAYAGHQVEKKVRTEKQWQVTVRFDDGSVRSYAQEAGNSWQNGDRVRVYDGKLSPL